MGHIGRNLQARRLRSSESAAAGEDNWIPKIKQVGAAERHAEMTSTFQSKAAKLRADTKRGAEMDLQEGTKRKRVKVIDFKLHMQMSWFVSTLKQTSDKNVIDQIWWGHKQPSTDV